MQCCNTTVVHNIIAEMIKYGFEKYVKMKVRNMTGKRNNEVQHNVMCDMRTFNKRNF